MMDLKEKLELLALADGFTVKNTDDGYEVHSNNAELMAAIDENGYIEYYNTGVKGSVFDFKIIEIDELLKLGAFCEALVK